MRLLSVVLSLVHAVMYAPNYTYQDYTRVAHSHPYASSVCRIYDPRSKTQLTGVLIAPNLVATAAHGLTHLASKDASHIEISFFNGPIVKGETFIIDTGYLSRVKGENAKYDRAFIKLSTKLATIAPARMLASLATLEGFLLTVLTYGQGDCPLSLSPVFRGFHLFETDVFFASGYDPDTLKSNQPLLLSSIFFNPNSFEEPDRTKEALLNWKKFKKKPYALALKGTSGAPVFININNEEYLLGTVTSFGLTTGQDFYADISLSEAFGKTHTIFAPFYLKTSHGYVLDPEIKKMIH